jgi:phage-related tail protein
MLSSVCRQRESLATMDSTVAVQTKGFGFSFQAAKNFRNRLLQLGHAAERAAANAFARQLAKTPNQRSTRFIRNAGSDRNEHFFSPGL